MNDLHNYHIQLGGQMSEGEINAMSPLLMTVVRVDADKQHPADKEHPADKDHPADKERPIAATLLTVCTDQSGLIGLLRYLHGLGFVLLSVYCERYPKSL